MKYATAAVVALASLVASQSISDIPGCALPCLMKTIQSKTNCQATDVSCVCKHIDDIQGPATPCILDACGPDTALNKVLPAAKALCAGGSKPSSAPASSAPASSAPASSAGYPAPPASSAPATSAAYSAPVSSAQPSQPAASTDCDESSSAAPTQVVPSAPAMPSAPASNSTMPQPPAVTAGASGMAPAGGLALLALGALML